MTNDGADKIVGVFKSATGDRFQIFTARLARTVKTSHGDFDRGDEAYLTRAWFNGVERIFLVIGNETIPLSWDDIIPDWTSHGSA